MRELPHSEEAEQRLLGACFIDGAETIARALQSKVTEATFYVTANRVIWGALTAIWGQGVPVATYLVADSLKSQGKLDDAGGFSYISQVGQTVPTTAQAGWYIGRLKELERLRAIIRTAGRVVEQAYGEIPDMPEFLAEAADGLHRVFAEDAGEHEGNIQAEAERLLAEVAEIEAGRVPEEIQGTVSWGLPDLDRLCGKLAPGDLVILGGRPSTGKSALADWTAWHCARAGGDVALFTYEMTKRDKAIRIAQQTVRQSYAELPHSPKETARAFSQVFREIRDCPHLHVFERDTAVNRMVARARALNSARPVRLVVVDFLQYLSRLEPTIGRERTDEKLGRITAAAKDLAKELKCPALVLSSLSRDNVKDGRRPTMADLRSSGEIESDADIVALLHWPENNPLTKQSQDAKDELQRKFYVEFNQEKGRNRGVHQVGLMFDRNATRFDCIGGSRHE